MCGMEFPKPILGGLSEFKNKFISIMKHRYLKDDVPRKNYEDALKRFKFLSLHRRREKADLLFLFKVTHGLINISHM